MVDLRKLNDVTVGYSFPIPVISDVLDSLGKSICFSTVDCASGFWKIPVRTEDRPKTAFSTENGLFEYKSKPFGLKGAPATFQRLMSTVLSGMQGLKCLVYLDDIIVYGETLQIHNDKLREVFARLRLHNLKLQPVKCEFLRKDVTYLVHKLTALGLRRDPEKVSAVKNFPSPTNTREIKQYLGLCAYYRKFIPNFSSIAKPLTELLKKNVPLSGTKRQKTLLSV